MELDSPDPVLQRLHVISEMQSLSDKRALQAKWSIGVALFFFLGPGPLLIAALDVFLGWSLPLTTGLEFMLVCWAGPTILLVSLGNWLGRQSEQIDYEANEARFRSENLRIVVPRTRVEDLRQSLDALVQAPKTSAGSPSQRELHELHELICRQIDTWDGRSVS